MAMPPEVMSALQKQGGAAPTQPQPGPAAAPMLTPQKPSGDQEQARLKIRVAQKLIEQALVVFGGGSKEGKALLSADMKLSAAFGKREGDADELLDSEKKTMAGSIPGGQPQGGPPGGAKPPMPPGGMPGGVPAPSG